MSNKITTLVLNLIISESLEHKRKLSARIIEILESQSYDCGGIEKEVKRLFVSKVQHFVENPNQESKAALFAVSQFHSEFYSEYAVEMKLAA
jgi:hypothetical protein